MIDKLEEEHVHLETPRDSVASLASPFWPSVANLAEPPYGLPSHGNIPTPALDVSEAMKRAMQFVRMLLEVKPTRKHRPALDPGTSVDLPDPVGAGRQLRGLVGWLEQRFGRRPGQPRARLRAHSSGTEHSMVVF